MLNDEIKKLLDKTGLPKSVVAYHLNINQRTFYHYVYDNDLRPPEDVENKILQYLQDVDNINKKYNN